MRKFLLDGGWHLRRRGGLPGVEHTPIEPVQVLAEQLEHAWADHHTRA